MTSLFKRISRGAEFVIAAMLAAMFITFLLQIFSRYILQAPLGWTLELILMLWLWIVFVGNAFVVREKDHVTFDIFYLAAPRRVRQILALVSAAAILVGMAWSFLPTLDWIDFLKIKKSAVLKVELRTVFSVYAVFMIAIFFRYGWRIVDVIRNGPPDEEHNILPENATLPEEEQ